MGISATHTIPMIVCILVSGFRSQSALTSPLPAFAPCLQGKNVQKCWDFETLSPRKLKLLKAPNLFVMYGSPEACFAKTQRVKDPEQSNRKLEPLGDWFRA